MLPPLGANDRLLRRFCRTGDPRLLGRLFDRVAPELLRAAMWLCGNRADAEDLLQRTFVTVIEVREKYDPTRRALPWLCGILGNHARKLHSRRERDLRLVVEPPTWANDPADAAAEAEFVSMLARLRDDIGEPYREVRDLHLGEGLAAKEIALALGRPRGTVRTQLMRGMDQLRRRLPGGLIAGMTTGVVLSATATAASLSAVRVTVMGHAAMASGAVSAAATTSVVLAGKPLLVLLSALVLLCVGAVTLSLQWAGGTGRDAPPATAQVGDSLSQATTSQAPVREGPWRAAVAERAGSADAASAALVVHVKWRHDGSPAAGVAVRAVRLDVRNRDQVEVSTDLDGRARLAGIGLGECAVVSAFTEVCVVAFRSAETKVIELEASRAGTVRGTVVDGDGAAVPGARLWLSLANDWTQGFDVGSSDSAGRFELAFGGMQFLGARQLGHVASYLRGLDPSGDQEVTLRLRGPGGVVSGRVFGADGMPIGGAVVDVGLSGGWRASNSTHERLIYPSRQRTLTSESGQFSVEGVEPGNTDLLVEAAGHGPFESQVTVESGPMRDVVVRLLRGGTVHGVVRDELRQPVPGVVIVANRGRFDERRARSAADGHFQLADLPGGGNALTVALGDRAAAATVEVVAGGSVRWDPILARGRSLLGVVVDTDGRPLAGLRVGLMEEGSPALQHAIETKADGRFALANIGAGPFELLVQHGDAPLLRRFDVVPGDEPLVVELAMQQLPSATIGGRIVDAEGRPLAAAVVVTNHAFGGEQTVATDPQTGRFRFGPTAAGSYTMIVEARSHGRTPLRVLDVEPGEQRRLDDIALPAAGRAEITLVGGGNVSRDLIKFARVDGTVVAHAMTESRTAAAELPPGDYVASLRVGEAAGSVVAFRVRSDQTTKRELICVPTAQVTAKFDVTEQSRRGRRIDIVIRDSAGGFVDAHEVHANQGRHPVARFGLSPGDYRIECHTSDGLRATEALSIRSPGERPVVTLQLR